MRTLFVLLLFLFFIVSVNGQKAKAYPLAPKVDAVDEYFGTKVEDPYRWMEDPNSADLVPWLEAQGKLIRKERNSQTQAVTFRAQLATMYNDVHEKTKKKRLVEEERELPKYKFRLHNNNQSKSNNLEFRLYDKSLYKTLARSKHYRKTKDENIEFRVNKVNEEENLVAITVGRNGGDWREIYVYDLITGEKLIDELMYARIGSEVVWHGRNFYYDRYDKPKEGRELLDAATGQKLYYHVLGTLQDQDKLMFENTTDINDREGFYFNIIEGRMFVNHHMRSGEEILRALSYADVDKEEFELKNFFTYPDDREIELHVTLTKGDSVFVTTNWYAPNGRVLLANVNEFNKATEFIPEYDVVLQSIKKFGKGKLVTMYSGGNFDVALIFDHDGQLLKKSAFPEGKKVYYFYEKDEKRKYTFFCVTAFYHPPLWYQISIDDYSIEAVQSVSVPYDPKSIETRYVEYASKDGTLIPMYITCLKDTKLNGKNPTLMYADGGYGTTIKPSFHKEEMLFVLHGGIFAVPNVRGGGAKGSSWSEQGRRLKKQNCFDDFIAATEYLISEKYTEPERIAAKGGSHGGMLIGAVITQRPELYHTAIIEAGVLDNLRFENYTIGNASLNISEFGTVTDSLDFLNLKSYSPVHNIKSGVKYPNVLLITGEGDDRVPPFHSYKFLATLQEKGDPTSDFQMYFQEGAGHYGAKTNKDWEEALLFKYYYLFDKLKVRFY